MIVRHAINRLLFSLCASCVVFGVAVPDACGQAANSRAPSSAASGKQPRVRFVSSSEVEIFAGPGQDFYPTAILKSGQSIEVLEETEDGWLAIVPPTGSFSWLPASQGLLLPGGRVVEVTEKSSVSWIGTRLGTAKQYRWQVKLERGQQLAVLGEQTIADSATGSKALWYKIAPPPGEYRWIEAKATSEEAPETEVVRSDSAATVAGEGSNSEAKGNNLVVQAGAQRPLDVGSGQRPSTRSQGVQPMPRQASHQHVDRWAQWHAVEFKNGSFSFPGLTRMLGMPPSDPPNVASAGDDPFDLNASYTRPKTSRPNASPAPMSGPTPVDAIEPAVTDPTTSQMAGRQSRGWRDPRQLREERMHGGKGEAEPSEMSLAARDSSMNDVDVMDAGFDGEYEVGTGVVTAGATAARRERSTAAWTGFFQHDHLLNQEQSLPEQAAVEQSWYGIDQAPTTPGKGPVSIAQASLDELQLELSAMVAAPESTWNLTPLAERARYFVEHGQDSLQRGQARLLLERIESFATVAQHSSALGLVAPPALSRVIPAAASAAPAQAASRVVPASAASWVAPPTDASGGANVEGSGAKFDATGWLVPVHSSGRDMPTHALTNDAGRIIVYVTPAPGVNLTRFESQPIGVFGLRGYLPQLKSNHIQIQRVVRLQ